MGKNYINILFLTCLLGFLFFAFVQTAPSSHETAVTNNLYPSTTATSSDNLIGKQQIITSDVLFDNKTFHTVQTESTTSSTTDTITTTTRMTDHMIEFSPIIQEARALRSSNSTSKRHSQITTCMS